MRDIFEKTLFENPDDLATYSAYADWLMEQNNPRGEFMQVQLRLEQATDEAERKNLWKRSRELQARYEDQWLGGLSRLLLGRGSEEFNYAFHRGWLNSLSIRTLRVTIAETLARSSAVMLLRELKIREIHREPPERRRGRNLPEHQSYLGLYPLARSHLLRNLTSLHIGEIARNVETSVLPLRHAETDPEPLLKLIDNNPGLERLVLFVPTLPWSLFDVNRKLSALRELVLCGGMNYWFNPKQFERLEKLTLIFTRTVENAPERWSLDQFSSFILSAASPNLRSLTLRGFFGGDAFCGALVSSGRLAEIESLTINGSGISGEGAKVLLHCPDFARVKELDLSRNVIAPDLVERIQKIHPRANLVQQGDFLVSRLEIADASRQLDEYDNDWE